MELLITLLAAIAAIAPLLNTVLNSKRSQRRKTKIILRGWFNSIKTWFEFLVYGLSMLFAGGYLYVYAQSASLPSRMQNILMVECIFLLFEFGIIAAYVYSTKKYGNKREQQEARIEQLEKQVQLLSEGLHSRKTRELELV